MPEGIEAIEGIEASASEAALCWRDSAAVEGAEVQKAASQRFL